MICEKCKNHKQISGIDFGKLPFRLARQLDCKNIYDKGKYQCTCYSIEHATDKEEIKQILS